MTSESASPQSQRRRLTVDSRRDELLAAAQDLFARMPPDEVNINDIAAAAGASRALVYHYFGGKNELYIASLRQTADELIERLTEPLEGTVVDQLNEGIRRYFEFAESHKAGFIALLRGGPARTGDEATEIVEEVRQILLDLLLTSTEIETPSPVLRITMHGWMAAVEVAALDWMVAGVPERSVVEQLLVGHLMAMLIPTASLDPVVADFLQRAVSAQ